MFEFKYDKKFKPSASTRWFWPFIYKTRYRSHGVDRPGLYNRPNLFWPATGVTVILALEVGATIVSYDYGVTIAAIVAAMIVDFGFALVAHLPTRTIVLEENRSLFTTGEEQDIALRKAARARRIQRAVYGLILISGLFKFGWFFMVYPVFNAISLSVLVCYLAGAVLHIAATGYFLFTAVFLIKLNAEERKYTFSKGQKYAFDPKNPTKNLVANGKLMLEEAQVGHHRLVFDTIENNHYLYTNGVLTDMELNELIARQQTPEQKYIVAREGVRVQMDMQ